jgi:hypothetical protein
MGARYRVFELTSGTLFSIGWPTREEADSALKSVQEGLGGFEGCVVVEVEEEPCSTASSMS